MPKILEIKKYPKFKDNFKIILDNDVSVIVDAETVVKFSLKKDLLLSDSELDIIIKHSGSNRIMSYALYLISHKSYSKKAITEKLLLKGFLQEDIEKVVSRFVELNYINDKVFAKNFAEYLKNKSKGIYYIKNELKLHNIEDCVISDILTDLFRDIKPHLQIIGIIKKKYPKFDGKNASEIKKIANFFLRRGFVSEDIAKAFREYKNITIL
ncbi:MAG: regulatory protein RecX [Endomicrobiaceae bacterium]